MRRATLKASLCSAAGFPTAYTSPLTTLQQLTPMEPGIGSVQVWCKMKEKADIGRGFVPVRTRAFRARCGGRGNYFGVALLLGLWPMT